METDPLGWGEGGVLLFLRGCCLLAVGSASSHKLSVMVITHTLRTTDCSTRNSAVLQALVSTAAMKSD